MAQVEQQRFLIVPSIKVHYIYLGEGSRFVEIFYATCPNA